MTINTLVTILVVVVVLLIGVLLVAFIVARNSKQPEANRKWTDPKFHD